MKPQLNRLSNATDPKFITIPDNASVKIELSKGCYLAFTLDRFRKLLHQAPKEFTLSPEEYVCAIARGKRERRRKRFE